MGVTDGACARDHFHSPHLGVDFQGLPNSPQCSSSARELHGKRKPTRSIASCHHVRNNPHGGCRKGRRTRLQTFRSTAQNRAADARQRGGRQRLENASEPPQAERFLQKAGGRQALRTPAAEQEEPPWHGRKCQCSEGSGAKAKKAKGQGKGVCFSRGEHSKEVVAIVKVFVLRVRAKLFSLFFS